MSAGQEYKRTIAAGGVSRINANGETFIFCAFADRDIRVNIAGREVTMRAGSYQEFQPLSTENSTILLFNDDAENPALVRIVTGTGTYDEKIVRGEITTITGVQRADGSFVNDTRYEIDAFISPVYGDTSGQINRGTVFAQSETVNNYQSLWQADGIIKLHDPSAEILYLFDTDLNTLGTVEELALLRVADNLDGTGYVGIRSGQSGIWTYNKASGEYTQLFNTVTSPQVVVAGDNEYVVMTGSNPLFANFYQADGTLRKNVNITDLSGITDVRPVLSYDQKNRQWSISRGPTTGTESAILNYEMTETVATYSGRLNDAVAEITSNVTSDKYIILAGVAFMYSGQLDRILKVQFQDLEYAFRGLAYVAGCQNELVKPGTDSPVVTAAIKTIEQGGRLVVTGEIIKAVLSLYLNAVIEPEYMDNVFSIEIFDTGGRQVTKSAGGRGKSLKALKINDDFRAVFPGRVRLLVDADLTTSERI